MNRIKNRSLIIILGIIVVTISGVTLGYWLWNSTTNTDISFTFDTAVVYIADGTDIVGASLIPEPSYTGTSAIRKDITVQLKETPPEPVTLTFDLIVNSIDTGLKDPSFKWILLKGGTTVSSGNFATESAGNTITLTTLSSATSTLTTTEDIYTLYIWIDGTMPNPNTMQNKTFDFTFNVTGTNSVDVDFPTPIAEKILADNIANNTYYNTHRDGLLLGESITVHATSNKSGLFTADGTETEGGATVYYFAGGLNASNVDVVNNWIEFGKDKATGNPLYWRIIRTNEDGGIRLLYVGTNKDTDSPYINTSVAFNTNYNQPYYVGYTYGDSQTINTSDYLRGTTESTIKGVLDTWYGNNISCATCEDSGENPYSDYISPTAIYCNDRSISESAYPTSGEIYFAPYHRVGTSSASSPSYRCGAGVYSGPKASGGTRSTMNFTSEKDKYSMSNTQAHLEEGIALMTADEIVFAGGKRSINSPLAWYYQQANSTSWWWLLSPGYWSGSNAGEFSVYGSGNPGRLSGSHVYSAYAARPVVSLSSNILYKSGNGTKLAPYEVELP